MRFSSVAFEAFEVVNKSGGHLMTVASIDEGSVTCDWSVSGDVKSKSFPAAELKHASEPETLEDLVLGAIKLRGEEGGGWGAISSVISRCRR